MWLFAFCFLTLPHVSSHPSLSARVSHSDFLWHLLTVLVYPSNCAAIYTSKPQCVFQIPPPPAKVDFSFQIGSKSVSETGGRWACPFSREQSHSRLVIYQQPRVFPQHNKHSHKDHVQDLLFHLGQCRKQAGASFVSY